MLNTVIPIFNSAGAGAAGTAYESIATVTVGSGGASNVEFTSIPGTFTHLQVRALIQTNRGTFGRDAFWVNFNSDTGSNYSFHYLSGDGSSVFAVGSATQTYIRGPEVTTSTAGASIFGLAIVDILDYANTSKHKTVRMLGGGDHNGTVAGLGAQVELASGRWGSTNAITSIKFVPQIGTSFSQYTHFALYGIKVAS